ncbi:MAG: SirB2 family protein [Proteobacteria bacterium]|nr:SirB2 family protein [Pseudomonadota bacterium]
MYLAIKHLHVTCVVLSGLGFLLRGAWMLGGSALLRHRLTRVLPHIIDTLLLGSALVLAALIGQYPFVAAWVTAKVLGLIAYILLGTVALKRGRTPAVRLAAFAAAIAVFLWIVSVALTKNPLGYLAALGAAV